MDDPRDLPAEHDRPYAPDTERLEALRQLAELSQELGLYDGERYDWPDD